MSESMVNVVADIGGTNIRLGISDEQGKISELEVFQCNDFASLADVLKHYFSEKAITGKSINACLAIACPVENDLISMTNLPWQFSKSALKATLNLNKLLLINDYTAIAHAVPFLSDEQKVQIGQGSAAADKPIAICGPGTGLGVAHVVPANGQWLSLGGEGGHVDFAPVDEDETRILAYLLSKYPRVSYEQVLSGLGLEQIYQALMFDKGEAPQPYSAKDISERALNESCDVCQQALAQFCKILGSFAGNLALTMAAFGGVYIAGGIVPRFIEYFKSSEFRSRFEAKGRFVEFNKTIPTFVITESQPGIIGASAYLRQHNTEEL
ncbi:glucokinase [Thalassomonas sp. RHCl1]|uniref:glucokinase n=1 Tax=Thalassomonas sp. RHCl1 TaxID=2995320 RepID=UPI00248B7A69|nr:glucokinase [Thalassomonas sp. RHCl1]